MTDFAQAFQNNQNNISEAVQWFKLFRPIVQSHRTFDARGGIYSVNVFPS